MNNEVLTNLSDEESIKLMGEIAPIFQKLIPIDNTIGVSDKEKFLFFLPGKELSLGNLEGTVVPIGSQSDMAMKAGTITSSVVPKEVFGIPFKSTAIPIKGKNGDIIGSISLAVSLKNQFILTEATEVIASSSEELAATSEEIASSATLLSENMSDVLNQARDIVNFVGETDKILDLVNSLAANSRLLGLNAAIEAARAGEQGRGFAVVADEIRKMAENSAKSVKEIKEIINAINKNANMLLNKMNNISDIAEHQSVATQQIAASTQQLAACAQDILKVSNVI